MEKSIQKMNSWGIYPTDKQKTLLSKYAKLILSKKDLFNLTKVENASHVWQRHITDAAVAVLALKKHLSHNSAPVVADVGAGAGYIGICFKILFPYAKMVLIESVEKKCAFLNWAISELALRDTEVLCTRVDAHQDILHADFVIERAMGILSNVLDGCLKLVKKGGFLAVYQGGKYFADKKIQTVLSKNKAAVHSMENYFLPYDDKKRMLLLFRKL
jgi:16S rRNA (guanine527-N7)-methyltransferase